MCMRISWKMQLGAVLLTVGATSALAQKFPVPGQKHPEWVLEQLPPASSMPVAGVQVVPTSSASTEEAMRGGQHNAETGALLNFYDRRTGIFYDVEHGLLHDRTTGQYYRFYRRGASPKPLPNPKFL